ncbi:MAG: hypothetical protein A2849_03225 [Candidatus Taylorbacteria bacterium RIFCSPHIGHO2_01_FULL_51_15]|uniref:ABC transporter ATP-binding protein n=1 Tax=Candidatus Taylorbacteria bacterium RIFCSPHIGHO2_01_FULL_51_15 TaxID=1802304 RepID=A0A1G2MBN6_9BACT|nr:MAG: hypothetical protein A2849_03225 [Candidatus Taylorbacteria bacterium RIFCSPHIGHO2_01_FULL_51_15]
MIKRVVQVMWAHTMRYPWTFLGLTLSVCGLIVSQVISPIYYKQLINVAASSGGVPLPETVHILFVTLGMIGVVKGGAWVARRFRGLFMTRLDSRVQADLAMTAFSGLIRHSYRFFSDNFAGTLVRRVNKFENAYDAISDQIAFNLFPGVLVTLGSLYVLFKLNFFLGLILLVGIVLFFVFNIGFAIWKQKYEILRNARDSEATGVLADAVGNSTTIKLFSGYRHEISLFRKVNEALRRARFVSWNLHELAGAIQAPIIVITELSMLGFAILLWQRGILTVGDFFLIQMYINTIYERIADFERVLRKLFESFADAGEMVEILDMPYEVRDVPGARHLIVGSGGITFNNITFAFNEAHPVLEQFSLSIAPHEKVALVGPSGAGKTTITRLLLRFHNLQEGTIAIDGQDIATSTLESLWDSVALVPQEPVLFHRTLKENILYGRRDASDTEIIGAAKRAHCHEFISQLPNGYDTYVGERGVKLSGGERQRVAIARAILKNAPILVLDEATSSLDSESESLIQDALHELMRGKTVIAIAHRLSTIKEMDRILVIDGGRIVAEGTHETLLGQKGIYQKLWGIQAGRFVD